MMVALPILAVTGSTGALGSLVAHALAADGVPQRLLARTVAKAPQLPGSVALPFSYSDRAACALALDGVQTLFMVSAAENAERLDQHRAFIDSARAAGVRHIVYTSFIAAAPDATFTLARDHYATEQYIQASGIEHTFLRDSLYLDFMHALVGADGVIRGPAGTGRVAAVARADVARTAVAVLRDVTAHRNVTYDLTGPEALTMAEVAQTLSAAQGSTVRFHDETLAEAYESRAPWGAPGWQVDAWVSTYTAIAAGEMAAVSTDIETITGLKPASLAQLLAG
ncbi:SDR family oxidoreductase [Cryobacterium sp. SO2]|uniref:SDR family oxidoreductase n=1 Tax=Cryobacterium sp. SO2 TaxID=1897060 RepID=UPI00223CB83A|nr:SDR family oxidoreductase [Cryobacterium sp. SO2]WEO76136.1 SDR family oxidoreductase [Cryobacterium sp. SO2]